MPKAKLHARNVKTLRVPSSGRLFYWDTSRDSPPWFGVRVNAPGDARGNVRRSYVVGYRLRKHERLLTLGKVGVGGMTLAAARKAAHEALVKVERGVDPLAEKRDANKPGYTVADLASEWLGSVEAKQWRPKTRAEFERLVTVEINDTDLAAMHPGKVARPDLRRLLDSIHSRSASVANHTRAVLRLMFAWALEHDRVPNIPTFPKKLSKYKPRERVLTTSEIRRVWNVLNGRMGDGKATPESNNAPLGRAGEAFRLMLMTAQRRGEVLSMTWADLDLARRWWTIPAERTKSKREHRVPLTAATVELLRALHNDAENVFPSPRPTEAVPFLSSVQKMATRLWKKAGVKGATLHDLRRTAAQFMGDMGVQRSAISLVLNHTPRDGAQATAIYDRSKRDAEKRDAMEKWGRKLAAVLSTTDEEEKRREKRANVAEFRR